MRLEDHQFTVTWINTPDKYVESWSGGYWQHQVIKGLGPSWLSPSVTVRSSDFDNLSFEALEAMRPSFSDASFFNDVLELNQIAELINPLGVHRSKGKTLKDFDVPLSERVRHLTSMDLWYQFGIKPMVQSGGEILRLLRGLPEAIRKLRANNNKVITRHFSRRMDNVDLPSDALVYNSGGIKVNRYTRWITAPIYHASIRYTYDLSMFSDYELQLRAWSQAFGLDRPLRIAWNAIPMSFVVDWFVDIGRWLGSLTSGDLIPIVVQDFCHSTKFEHNTTAIIEYPFGTGAVKPVVTQSVGNRSVLSYDRRRGLPCSTSRLRFNMPSVPQVFTLGALALQRMPRKYTLPNGRRLPWLRLPSRGIIR
jgi:hypothetical protein